MTLPPESRIYHEIVIEAESSETEILLVDDHGHPVLGDKGVFRISVIPGEYYVEFGDEDRAYLIKLNQDLRLTESQVKERPSRSRPIPIVFYDN